MGTSWSELALWGVLLLGCDGAAPPRWVPTPDAGLDATRDAAPDAPVDAAVDGAADMGAVAVRLPSEPLLACAAAVVDLPITLSAAATVEVEVAGERGRWQAPAGTSTLRLPTEALPEGAHPLSLWVAGRRLDGPPVWVDRTPPSIRWEGDPDACTPMPPAPVVEDAVDPEPRVELSLPEQGCVRRGVVLAEDRCGHVARLERRWRTGPPEPPAVAIVSGVPGWARLTWDEVDPMACRAAIRAAVGRVAGATHAYGPGELIDVPGPHDLAFELEGCGGPATASLRFAVADGPCDVGLPDLRDPRFARARWEALGPILAEARVQISAAAADPGGAAPLREALERAAARVTSAHARFALDPGLPGPCFLPEGCAGPADWLAALADLDAAAAALSAGARADAPVRAWQRCVQRAAETELAFIEFAAAERGCAAPGMGAARAAASAWSEEAGARRFVGCAARRAATRCLDPELGDAGCPPPFGPAGPCAGGYPVPRQPDPLRFVQRLNEAREGLAAATGAALAGERSAEALAALGAVEAPWSLGCLGEPGCPLYPTVVGGAEAWRAWMEAVAVEASPELATCAAAGGGLLHDLFTLLVGWACPEIHRHEHPGLRAAEVARALAAAWPAPIGAPGPWVERAVAECLTPGGLLPPLP